MIKMQLHCRDFINISKKVLQATKSLWQIKPDRFGEITNKEIA